MNEALSILFVIISFFLLIYLSFKGFGQLFAPLLCAALVALVAKGGFINAVFTLFPSGAGNFMSRLLMPYIAGTIFGQVMSYSRAGQSIGQFVSKKLGRDNGPYVILIMTFIVTMSGMSLSAFAVAAIAHSVLKESDLPPYIGLVCYCGMADITAFCIPGAPIDKNVLPTTYLGTDLYAGGLAGGIGAAAGLAFVLFYVRYLTKKARRENIGYSCGNYAAPKDNDGECPPFALAIAPLCIVVVLTYVLQKVVGWNATVSVFASQTLATAILFVTCRRYFDRSLAEVTSEAAKKVGLAVLVACCLCGYAAVVSDTSAFSSLQSMIGKMNLNPYVMTVISVSALAAISADSNSSVILFLETFASKLLAMPGVDPGIIHRLTLMSATAFDSVPHSATILVTMEIFGIDFKKGYKYVFFSAIVPALIATVVGLLLALIVG